MYKVLIAEDEMLVRTGIRASIDWEKFNMFVVCEASNGQIAWELYQQHKPDLVLTDIKMPLMDGIEFIRKIREEGHPTQVIILSCLEDFSLAKEAIRLGVTGYILKLTMTTEEMEDVLSSARAALDEVACSKTSSVTPVKLSEIMENNLLGCFVYNLPTLSDCLDTLKSYDVTIYPHDIVVTLMEIDRYEQLQDIYQDSRGQLIQFSILNIVNEILTKNHSGFVIHESGARYLLLFHSETEQGSFHLIASVLDEIRTILNNYFNVSPLFYISEMSQSASRLRQLYQQCIALTEYRFFLSPGSMNYYSSSFKSTIIQSLLSRTRQALGALSDDTFSGLLLKPLEDELQREFSIKSALNIFYDGYIAILHKYQPDEKEAFQRIRDFLQTLSSCQSYYEMLQQFLTFAKTLEKLARERIFCSREIIQALSFLQNNYGRQITLNEVAGLVGLSPNYFSSIFKKELGTSFLEYLNRYRIEKSMELLQNTSLKTYEIAFRCGFSDEGYYGKTFKKYTGKTPNEYKKSCAFTAISR